MINLTIGKSVKLNGQRIYDSGLTIHALTTNVSTLRYLGRNGRQLLLLNNEQYPGTFFKGQDQPGSTD